MLEFLQYNHQYLLIFAQYRFLEQAHSVDFLVVVLFIIKMLLFI